jgi:hypothetical protein
MRTLILLAILLVPSWSWAGEVPQWKDFDGLFHQDADSALVRGFLNKFNLRVGQSKGEHEITDPYHSFTVMFRKGAVDCIVLRATGGNMEDTVQLAYAGELPFGIKPDDTPKMISERLGTPELLPGQMWKYKNYKIAPVYLYKGQSGPLDQVYIWKPLAPDSF